jgi:hypothetical protein
MNRPHGDPTLEDVIEANEHPVPDRREHGKSAPHPDEDELERRTEFERREVGLDGDS